MEHNFGVEEVTISELQKALNKGLVTSKELVMIYLERIGRLDQNGPKLNAILEINPDALLIAEALDYERQLHGARSNLHGIPILVKDNFETADRMHTSAGSLALKNNYAKKDAFVINKLRQAGAIILGKTNMTEWADFMTDSMPAGYSSRGGQVLNPYGVKEFTPGGSSSGSGVGVTCNYCSVALGTETNGSIINPSCELGIVGIKPTVGLVSRTGLIPASLRQDTPGPMARTVEDATILLNELVGYDELDPVTICNQLNEVKDYTKYLEKNDLKDVRIGVLRSPFFDNLSVEENSIMENVIKNLKLLNATIIDNITITKNNELQSKTALVYEFKAYLNNYLSKLSSNIPVHSLKELVEYHDANSQEMLVYGQTYLDELNNNKKILSEYDYVSNCIKDINESKTVLEQVISEHALDVMLAPIDTAVSLANKAGYPMITVPAGLVEKGKPFGITFVGKSFSEPILIRVAYAFEQHGKKRIPPKFNKLQY